MTGLETQYDEAITIPVGALAAKDVISSTSKIDASRGSGFRLVKSNVFMSYSAKTDDEGPLIWGMSANMSAAQVEAAMEADPQTRAESDDKGEGQALWPIGIISKNSLNSALLDERMWVVKPNWSIIEGGNLLYWVFNMDTGAVTTGLILDIYAQHFGVWLKD